MGPPRRCVLITINPADATRFADRSPDGRPYDLVHHWPAAIGNVPAAPRFSLVGQVPEAVAAAREEAARIVQRLVASDWWTVRGVNLARLLRDLLVREIGQQLLSVRRAGDLCEELQPSVVQVPSPLSPGRYIGDEMVAEGLRLVAQARGVDFATLGSPLRAARAALSKLQRRVGLQVTANWPLRRALPPPAERMESPSPATGRRPPAVAVGPCSAAELQAIQPLANALRARGWRIAPFSIPYYYARADWRPGALPEPVIPLGAWGDRHTLAATVRASRELLARLADPSAQARHHAVFNAFGVNLLESAYCRARLARLLTVEARVAMALYESARRMCETLRPALLLSSKGEGPEVRALMVGVRDAGVPVAFMPHGVVSDDPRWDDVPADLALADSGSFAEIITRRTSGQTPVLTIGAPKYDDFLRSREAQSLERTRAALVSRWVIGRGIRDTASSSSPAIWLGVAATDNPDRDRANVAAVAAFARVLPQPAAIVVKTHPRRSQPELVRTLRESAGPTGIVVTGGDTMEVMWCCDVVVTGASTAAIEAMAAGRPVVYVGSLEEDMYGYARQGAALHADGPGDLPATLSAILSGRLEVERLIARGRDFAARHLGPLDGQATERGVAALEQLAGR